MPETSAPAVGRSSGLSIAGFVFGVFGLFILIGWYITDLQGGAGTSFGAGVSPERGEALFWGDGTCHTCHAVGERGNMKRGPNLGSSSAGSDIGERAEERAKERAEALGEPFTGTDYLVEAIANPSAYIVKGFPDKLMPLVFTGQVDLEAEDVMSLVAYLQTLGGDANVQAIHESMARHGRPVLEKARLKGKGEAVRPIHFASPLWEIMEPEQSAAWVSLSTQAERQEFLTETLDDEQQTDLVDYGADWIEEGQKAFKALKCWQCHVIKGYEFGALQPGNVGPDLTGIGSIQTMEYLIESVVNPDALIVPPLEKHAKEGHSKMPSFVQTITVDQLTKVGFFMKSLTTDAKPPEPAPEPEPTPEPDPAPEPVEEVQP